MSTPEKNISIMPLSVLHKKPSFVLFPIDKTDVHVI